MGSPRFANEWTGLVAVSCNVFIEALGTPAAKLRGSSSLAQADLRMDLALASTRLFPFAHCGFIYNEAAIFVRRGEWIDLVLRISPRLARHDGEWIGRIARHG
jgi:hypothetical protein